MTGLPWQRGILLASPGRVENRRLAEISAIAPGHIRDGPDPVAACNTVTGSANTTHASVRRARGRCRTGRDTAAVVFER